MGVTALTTMVATGWSLLRHEHTPAKPQDWVRFVHAPDWKTTKVGRLEEDNVIEYAGADIFTPLEPTGRSFPVAQVKLLTPFEVRSIVALWNNFHERAKKENQSIPNFPLIFMKPTSSVIGPEQIIERPLGKNHDDGEPTRVIYEAELGVVIGTVQECERAGCCRLRAWLHLRERRDGSPDLIRVQIQSAISAVDPIEGVRHVCTCRTCSHNRTSVVAHNACAGGARW